MYMLVEYMTWTLRVLLVLTRFGFRLQAAAEAAAAKRREAGTAVF